MNLILFPPPQPSRIAVPNSHHTLVPTRRAFYTTKGLPSWPADYDLPIKPGSPEWVKAIADKIDPEEIWNATQPKPYAHYEGGILKVLLMKTNRKNRKRLKMVVRKMARQNCESLMRRGFVTRYKLGRFWLEGTTPHIDVNIVYSMLPAENIVIDFIPQATPLPIITELVTDEFITGYPVGGVDPNAPDAVKGVATEPMTYEDMKALMRNISLEDHYLKCKHCGAQSSVDPALLRDEAPMPYCNECDEPLL